jgi:hypothetical protein
MARVRVAGYAGSLVVAALVGGTLMSSVAAAPLSAPPVAAVTQVAPAAAPSAPPTTAPATTARTAGKYCADFRETFAANLGVDPAKLGPAARDAALSTVDDAVAAGDLSTAAGARLKAAIKAAPTDGCGLLGRLAKRAAGAAAVAQDGFQAGADALELTPAELRADLRSGQTLQQVAAAQGVAYDTVTAAITTAIKTDLDAAVKAGKLTQSREDRILDRLARLLANGRMPRGQATLTGIVARTT